MIRAVRQFLFAIVILLSTMAPAAARPVNWVATVAATPGGGYRIGNPAAPVRIIEYFSLTCSHCRHFAQTGMAPLKARYVAQGKVSIELRNFILNGPDLAASLLMRCAPPARAVALYGQVYAQQEKVFEGLQRLAPDAQARIQATPEAQRAAVLAQEGGILGWFVTQGVPAARGAACLADPKGTEQLLALRAEGIKVDEVQGTPAFVVNGKRVDGGTWEELEPAIKAALASAGR